jgi:hypothetical protein
MQPSPASHDFAAYFARQSFVPGPLERQQQPQKQPQKQQVEQLESFLGQHELLPYSTAPSMVAPRAATYSVNGLTNDWFCAPQMQTERCGCGGPKTKKVP